jgi:DNA-binding NarL/FixJ family response regulator
MVEQGLGLLDDQERLIAERLRTGRTWQQIADELQMTRDAVRKHFYRAVERLKQHLLGSTSDDLAPKGSRRP